MTARALHSDIFEQPAKNTVLNYRFVRRGYMFFDQLCRVDVCSTSTGYIVSGGRA
jgi:hypothetical protein